VIFTEREISEVLKSQATMLQRLGKGGARSARDPSSIATAYGQQAANAKRWCRVPRVAAMSIDFRRLVVEPDTLVPALAEFFGRKGKEL